MATWASFRAAVAAALSAAMPAAVRAPAQNNGPTVTWFDDRRPFARHRLLLSIVSVGYDHDRDSALSRGGEQELSSMATVAVQVQAESSHDPSGAPSASPGDALWLIEQVRLGLRRVSVAEALHAAGCPIVGFPEATVKRSYPADGRIISAASFDVRFRTVFEFDTSGDAPVQQIERVEAEGENGDVDGVAIAVDDPDPDV